MTRKSTEDSSGRAWPVWRWLATDFLVIVVGVLVALGVDAAWDAHEDRERADAYLTQLHADLLETSAALKLAEAVDARGRDGADRAIRAFNGARLPPAESLTTWIVAAVNSSADFYPTMGTIMALVESGDLRLFRNADLRQKVLRYQNRVESSLRIVDAVDPHMWRAMERFGQMISWSALLEPEEPHRFPVDWEGLARDPAFHGALYDLRLAAHNRLYAMRALRIELDSLLVELDRSAR